MSNLPSSPHITPDEFFESEEDTFYDLCVKKKICCERVPWFKFKSRKHSILCGFFTLLCASLLIAVIVPLIVNSLLDDTINQQVVIDSTSADNYESWQTNTAGSGKDDLQIFYKLRYFDLQNPQEVVKGAKPVVVEVGPYTYTEYFYKFDISWSDHGDTVTYNTYRYYVFNEEATGAGLSESDQITLPYPTVIGFEFLLNKFEAMYPGISVMLDSFIYQQLQQDRLKAYADMYQLYLQALTLTPAAKSKKAIQEITSANNTITLLFDDMEAFVLRSDGVRLLLKTLMCKIPNGVSTFYKVNPGPAWFGYPKDDLLVAMTPIIQALSQKLQKELAWSVAVPGAAVNYTSLEDARRRRNVDVFKTGKRNPNQVGQYVMYQNMTTYHTCVNPVASPQQPGYIAGQNFPACTAYQNTWTEGQASQYGYTLPFETDYANRIAGTDASMFGRPMRSSKQQMFVSDIYRSAFMYHSEDVDWNGIKVQEYQLQYKDTLNATMNPENGQYYSYGPSGILNCTKAANIPVFISYPHFYLAEDSLVSAVKGLSPNQETHESKLLMEPQTGLLVEAKKRLQVNYLMEDYYLPEANSSSIALANSICASIDTIVTTIGQPAPFDCNDMVIMPMLECLVQPSNWTYEQGHVYFPYGWVAEEFELPVSDANSLKSSLLMVNDVSTEIRFWALIIAGICFAIMAAMIGYGYYQDKEDKVQWEKYRYQHGLLGANGEHTMPLTVEPLLDNANYNPTAPTTTLDTRKSMPESYAFSG